MHSMNICLITEAAVGKYIQNWMTFCHTRTILTKCSGAIFTKLVMRKHMTRVEQRTAIIQLLGVVFVVITVMPSLLASACLVCLGWTSLHNMSLLNKLVVIISLNKLC